MNKALGTSKLMLGIIGVINVIAGLYAIFHPILADALIPLILAVVFIANGAIVCFQYFISKKNRSLWNLVLAVIEIVLGILILTRDLFGWFAVTYFVAYMTGGALVALGIIKSINSFTYKKDGMTPWWAVLVLGIVDILMGLIIFFNPLTIGIYAGAGLLADGISSLMIVFLA